jgi:hypothetical protein
MTICKEVFSISMSESSGDRHLLEEQFLSIFGTEPPLQFSSSSLSFFLTPGFTHLPYEGLVHTIDL